MDTEKNPTPEQIMVACLELQSSWSEAERNRRLDVARLLREGLGQAMTAAEPPVG